MSITDELRQYADDLDNKAAMKSEHGFSPIGMRLERIADSIDAQHERDYREQYTNGHDDGFDEGYASADAWYVDQTENLAEHGWVKLPKDADGKVIHIGDKLVCDYTYGETITVLDFGAPNCHDDDQGVFAYNGDERCWFNADCLHHVEHTTVADVLRDFRDEVRRCCDTEDTINEFADRIRKVVCDE